MMPLTTDTVSFSEDFDIQGYSTGIDVLRENEVLEVKSNFRQLEQSLGREHAQYSLHNIHVKYSWVLKLATHIRVLTPLKEILGEDLILLDSRFICKYPSEKLHEDVCDDQFVAWHQDVRYWGITGDVVSVWLAVDDADIENGCMIVIPGSHKMGILEHQIACKTGNMLTSNQEIPSYFFDATKAVPCPLKAGQMSLHHGHLVHGSETNHTSRRRCGFVIRFVSTSAKPINDPERPRKFESTVLVSGEDTFSNFSDNVPEWFTWR